MIPSLLSSLVLSSLISGTTSLSNTASSRGCGKPLSNSVQPNQSVNLTLVSSSGVTPRKYRLHLPAHYHVDRELPLILSFHGRGKDAKFQEELSQFSNASYGFDGIVVYPEGVPVIVAIATVSIVITNKHRLQKAPNSSKVIRMRLHQSTMSHLHSSFWTTSNPPFASTLRASTQPESRMAEASLACLLATQK